MNTTIEKKITDMSKYGITGDMQWSGDVIVKSDQSIQVHGKYFPTKEEAEAYADRIVATIESIRESNK